jgi:hypothetical protein
MKPQMAVAIAAMILSVGAGAQTAAPQNNPSNTTPSPPIGTGTIDNDQGAPSSVHNGSSNNTSNSSMARSRQSKAQRSQQSSGTSGTAGCAGGTGKINGASNSGNADGSLGGNPDCRSSSDQTKKSLPPAGVGQTNAGTANGSDNDPARK